jgi:hypothetical protein
LWHDVTNLQEGSNEISIRTEDTGKGASVFFDGLFNGKDGEKLQLFGADDWLVTRENNASAPVRLGRQAGLYLGVDPISHHLVRRPHPLPGAAWLEDEPADDTVVALGPDAFPGQAREEWLYWTAPPGAITAHVPVDGDLRCFIDGVEVAVAGNQVTFPTTSKKPSLCVARIQPNRGRTGGGLLEGPVTYQVGMGELKVGDWGAQGLAAYSGGVRYSTSFEMGPPTGKRYRLDLGQVRGTTEILVNGELVGERIWAPYCFDITAHLKEGSNTIEVLVLNTLGPYLKSTSPTPFVFAGQEVSGILGPVRILSSSEQDSVK